MKKSLFIALALVSVVATGTLLQAASHVQPMKACNSGKKGCSGCKGGSCGTKR